MEKVHLSQLSKDFNKVPLLLQNLGSFGIFLRSWKKLVTTTVLNDFIGVFCLNLYLRIWKAHWNSKNWQDLCFVLQTNRLSNWIKFTDHVTSLLTFLNKATLGVLFTTKSRPSMGYDKSFNQSAEKNLLALCLQLRLYLEGFLFH